jgi:conjugal transfer mating pair stabilization protein TraN
MLVQAIAAFTANAGSRFVETSPCSNAVKTCVGGRATKIIEGFEVTCDCWEWAYVKTCNYPSKNDCRLFEHCYAVGDLDCLLKDSLGSCVNLQREFSCKSWDVVNKDNQTARMGFEEKPGKDGLICKGIPCIDGNCVDKSYETNGEMMDSL